MSLTVGAWKAYTARQWNVQRQPNYFDHRIRGYRQLQTKATYICRNPIVKGLCRHEADWPWVWPHSYLAQPAQRSGSTGPH